MGKFSQRMSDQAQPDRWIFGFRRTGRRDLDQDERRRLRFLAVKLRLRSFGWGFVAVTSAVGGLFGVIMAAGGWSLGWIVLILGTAACCAVLCIANSAESLSITYRQAFRKGYVHVYAREERPPSFSKGAENYPVRKEWARDERFQERIFKQAGRHPDRFETTPDEYTLVTVEGRIVDRPIGAAWDPSYD